MFAFLGGVPKADRFDPGLNCTYAEMAAHYCTAILPARPRKPWDKAKVEVAIQVAQRWILARLRNHRFFSLAELNVAIRRLLDALNMRLMRGYGASRADLFATLNRPNLQPLPPELYVFARWKRARVAPDYHVEVDSSWYSVPFAVIKQEGYVRVSGQTVEIFHRGQRVASHVRCLGRRNHMTVPDHMPSAHRRLGEWASARMLAQATKTGPTVAAFCDIVMADRPHPAQGLRTCLGVLAMVKTYGPERVNAACQRGATSWARLASAIPASRPSATVQMAPRERAVPVALQPAGPYLSDTAVARGNPPRK